MSMEVVNGYVCRNCTDVEYAKKGVDPARPQDGPEGVFKVDKAGKAEKAGPPEEADQRGPAVTFDGALRGMSPSTEVQPAPYVPGAIADLRV